MSNANRVFDGNPDYLKQGKLIEPSIGLKGSNGLQRLGKFYSDYWEYGSDSRFITCKGFDILYGLQSIFVSLPYNRDSEGVYTAPVFSSVYEAFTAVLNEVNAEKHRNEIYGTDIEFVIDDMF